jgi:hypothetical protein
MGFHRMEMSRHRPRQSHQMRQKKLEAMADALLELNEDGTEVPDAPKEPAICLQPIEGVGICGSPITGIMVSRRQKMVACFRCWWVSKGKCWECGLLPHQRQSSKGLSTDVLCLPCRISRNPPRRAYERTGRNTKPRRQG